MVMCDVELDRSQDAHPRIQHPIMRAGVYLDTKKKQQHLIDFELLKTAVKIIQVFLN